MAGTPGSSIFGQDAASIRLLEGAAATVLAAATASAATLEEEVTPTLAVWVIMLQRFPNFGGSYETPPSIMEANILAAPLHRPSLQLFTIPVRKPPLQPYAASFYRPCLLAICSHLAFTLYIYAACFHRPCLFTLSLYLPGWKGCARKREITQYMVEFAYESRLFFRAFPPLIAQISPFCIYLRA